MQVSLLEGKTNVYLPSQKAGIYSAKERTAHAYLFHRETQHPAITFPPVHYFLHQRIKLSWTLKVLWSCLGDVRRYSRKFRKSLTKIEVGKAGGTNM